jgi:hypothetical protein
MSRVEEKKIYRAPAFIETAIEEIAVREGFKIGRFAITYDLGAEWGDGFLSVLYKATVKEGDDSKQLNLMCKISPLSDGQKDPFDAVTAFERETFWYNKVATAFRNFLAKKGVGPAEFNFVPSCYFTRYDTVNCEIGIIMEDLKHLGYKMWDKANPVDLAHTTLVMKSLGKLHAVSLAMKHQDHEGFELFKNMPDMLGPMFQKDMWYKMMEVQFDKAIGAIEDTFAKEKIIECRGTFLDDMAFCADPSNAEPYAVVNHGDCWSNNFMFQYGVEIRPSQANVTFLSYFFSYRQMGS